MAIIQAYPDELDWVNAKLHKIPGSESFLSFFCGACLRADAQNYEILRPALLILMQKYPADPKRLAAER